MPRTTRATVDAQMPERRVLLANPRGFCAGVVRAIEAVENALGQFGAPVYVRRHIVHNQIVVAELEAKGAIFVKELDEIPEGAVTILSAHGVSQSVLRHSRQRRLRTLDTTCPLVAKVHTEVIAHYRAGRHVLLVGHQGHPEIVGTLGQVPSGAISVVSSPADVAELGLPRNTLVAYAVQTTFSVQDSEAVIQSIKASFDDVAGPRASDICYATTNRQAAIELIAGQSDCVLVVGDRMSSNANRLVEVALAAGCPQAYLVDNRHALPWDALDQAAVVGVTAGASTPDSAVADVLDALAKAGFSTSEVAGKQENISFKPVSMQPAVQDGGDDPFHQALARLQHDIDAFLTHLLPEQQGAAGRLTEAMRYAVIGGGKRLRAMLTVSVAQMFNAPYAQALRVAAAIELVHAQSLIHDDLPCMDNDDLRRGKPTVHRQFDEATAVLAGDALLALAFEILADEETHADARVRTDLVCRLAHFIGHKGLAAGQMMDLYPPAEPTRDDVFECENKKTGGLIRFAVEAGTMLGQCGPKERDSLLSYADKLGLAFQIRDDVLDRVGDDAVVGKKLRKDVEAGRSNAVHLLGLKEANRQTELLARGCHEELAQFGQNARILSEIASFAVSRLH